MQARVNTYLQAVAPLGREAGRIGPFLATCTPTSDNPYLTTLSPRMVPSRAARTSSTWRPGSPTAIASHGWST